MSFDIQIGSKIITLPDQGESPDWGEGVVEFFKSVEQALQTVQGPQDILPTIATLANGSSGNVNLFSFDTAEVKQIFAEYTITRKFTDATPDAVDYGVMEGGYDGSEFTISTRAVEGSGGAPQVELDITNTGQVTYTAANVALTDTITILFKARATVNE